MCDRNTVGYATMNSFYQQNQNPTMNTDATTNVEEYCWPSSTRVRMKCRAYLLRLECQLSSLLLFVRFSYQFRSVICLFVQCIKVK